MQVVIKFSVDNASFGESEQDRNDEIGLVLQSLIVKLERTGHFPITVHDVNGNVIGEMVLEEDEIECAYCYGRVPDEQGQPVPAVDDEDEWERLEKLHSPDCEWVLTKAHRVRVW